METNEHPFDALMAQAKTAPSEEEQIACFKGLWKRFLELDTWIFLTTGVADLEHASPFIGIIEEQPWALVFTDPEKAGQFAGPDPRFRDAEGNLIFMGIPTMEAVAWVMGLGEHGVVGLRINQGEFGWYAPLANLPAIARDLAHEA
ncbi:MAG TPA: hypothetical protein VJ570_06120 [Holophagaceae bacterium]|nr:hypothetical protein [Holophagaceae bacterium]